jgi:hypothetical protein
LLRSPGAPEPDEVVANPSTCCKANRTEGSRSSGRCRSRCSNRPRPSPARTSAPHPRSGPRRVRALRSSACACLTHSVGSTPRSTPRRTDESDPLSRDTCRVESCSPPRGQPLLWGRPRRSRTSESISPPSPSCSRSSTRCSRHSSSSLGRPAHSSAGRIPSRPKYYCPERPHRCQPHRRTRLPIWLRTPSYRRGCSRGFSRLRPRRRDPRPSPRRGYNDGA